VLAACISARRQQYQRRSNTEMSRWITAEARYFHAITLHPCICPLSAEIEPSGGGLGSLVTLRRHNWWQMLRSVNGQRSICVVESSVEGISETDFMSSCFVYRFPNAINICDTSLTMCYTGLNKGACVQSDTDSRTQTTTSTRQLYLTVNFMFKNLTLLK